MSRASIHASSLRHQSYDTIVFSPHLDDAVYSLAGTMLHEREAGRRVLVATVFGHGLDTAPSGNGPYDDYATREAEDREAMHTLDLDYVWLNLPELLFRRRSLRDRVAEILPHASLRTTHAHAELERALASIVESFAHAETRVYLPLGIGAHPDHRLVHEAGRATLAGRDLRFYEDIPYALEASLVAARFSVLRGVTGPNVASVARATAKLVFRGIGRTLGFVPLCAFFLLAELARASKRVRGGLDLLLVDSIDLRSTLGTKADAMRAYRTQTPLFFQPGVEECLRVDGSVPAERAWRFA